MQLKYLLLLFFSLSVLPEKSDYNMPVGVTEVSKDIFDLHMLIMWVCVWIGVVVFGIMFWSLWKYRKSSGAVAAKFNDNFRLEIAWTILATLILIGMAIPSTSVMIKSYDDSEGDINIMVTGYQWKWQYTYLEDNISFFSSLATSQEQIDNLIPKGEFYLTEVEKIVMRMLEARLKMKTIDVQSVLLLDDLKGYVVVEAQDVSSMFNAIQGLRHVRGQLRGELGYNEIEKYLVKKSVVTELEIDKTVEIVGGPFKGMKATITRVDKEKEEATVLLLDAPYQLPITVDANYLKLIPT